MPLFKKTPFALLEPPKDLEPHELVYQVRFTKEIFHDYQEYLNRINLYRQRTWTCKISGKGNLTYEEALVSEKHAAEKVHAIPKELVAPALRIMQFSMLSLKDLADTIASNLQEQLLVGMELQGRKNDCINPCRILKVVREGTIKTQYEVAWIDVNKEILETSLVDQDDLIRRKLPLSRRVLKSFIRESTYRSAPWVLHEKLAKKHCIPSGLPEEFKEKVFVLDGVVCNKKKKRNPEEKKNAQETEAENGKSKKSKAEDDNPEEEPVNYPIDDLLVKPGVDDPVFTERPPLSRHFNVPMQCVGDLVMIWDFCSSFSRLLHLWPFSLEDLENAVNHKDGHLSLIVETHSAFLRLLIKDNGEYSLVIQKRSRKLKITLINWTEYLCDFLEMINLPDLCSCITTIKRGHYSRLDAETKISILRELVNQTVATNLVREKLDDYIEQRHVLAATRREIALQEGRKKRVEKEQLKAESVADGLMDAHVVRSVDSDVNLCHDQNDSHQNGEMVKINRGQISSQQNLAPENRSNHSVTSLKLTGKKQIPDVEYLGESIKVIARKEALKQLKDEKKEAAEKKTKEQRREYFAREIEKRVLRTNSLGTDRYYNRYWWFQRDGQIFVESSDSKLWGYYSTKDELDALMGSLNLKGERERALHIQLDKLYIRISSELQKKSKDLAEIIALDEAVLRRSTRVRAMPKENQTNAFLRYVNKWKED